MPVSFILQDIMSHGDRQRCLARRTIKTARASVGQFLTPAVMPASMRWWWRGTLVVHRRRSRSRLFSEMQIIMLWTGLAGLLLVVGRGGRHRNVIIILELLGRRIIRIGLAMWLTRWLLPGGCMVLAMGLR